MSELENGDTIILTKRGIMLWLAVAGFVLPLCVSMIASFVTYRVFVAETTLVLKQAHLRIDKLEQAYEERSQYMQNVDRRLSVIEGKVDIVIQRYKP